MLVATPVSCCTDCLTDHAESLVGKDVVYLDGTEPRGLVVYAYGRWVGVCDVNGRIDEYLAEHCRVAN